MPNSEDGSEKMLNEEIRTGQLRDSKRASQLSSLAAWTLMVLHLRDLLVAASQPYCKQDRNWINSKWNSSKSVLRTSRTFSYIYLPASIVHVHALPRNHPNFPPSHWLLRSFICIRETVIRVFTLNKICRLTCAEKLEGFMTNPFPAFKSILQAMDIFYFSSSCSNFPLCNQFFLGLQSPVS
jgi:hypothetical protein